MRRRPAQQVVGVGPQRRSCVVAGLQVASIGGGREALTQLQADGQLPSVIVASHDLLAAGVLLGGRSQGLRVPDDVAVVGFDDGPMAEALGLTTVRQLLETSGQVGARLLLSALDDPDQPVQHIELELQLIHRTTT